jgi:hypothetical protein
MGFVADAIGSHRQVWHNGYAPKAGGYCFNAIFPEDQLAVTVLSNAEESTFRGLAEHIVKSVLILYDPGVAPQNSKPASNAPQDDPAVHELTLKMWGQMSSGNVDRSLLSTQMNTALTPDLLKNAAPQLQALGKLENITLLEKTPMEKGTNYVYTAQFSTGAYKIQIFVTSDGEVGGYRVVP